MATLFTPFFQPVDANGNPLAGAKLYFYQTGTSTPLNTYTTSALTTPNANPVVADSNGRFGSIYLGTSADYKITLKDSADTTIATVDPYFSAGSTGRVTVADVNYALAVSDRFIAYTTLTGARTVTLLAASAFPAGTPLTVVDEAGGATAAVTLSFVPNGTDTINGANATTVVVNQKNGNSVIESDGVSKWTLTRVSKGPTQQIFTSGSGTYTTPALAKSIKVRVIGAGAGGGGVGNTTNPTGTTGGTSTFNSINAVGGSGGTGGSGSTNGKGGLGGTGGTGTATVRWNGGAGFYGGYAVSAPANSATGGNGGSNPFGGSGLGGTDATVGGAGAANTGAGGGGGGGVGGSAYPGGGGGSGEYFELIIVNPAATYSYVVGAGGAGGIGTGTSAQTGGAGAAGQIIVEESYA